MPPIVEPTFLPNKGIDLSKPEQFLLAQFSPYSRNMEFYNELMQGRLGLTKFDPAVLSGPVLRTEQYFKNDGSYYEMILTTKDIYKYDFSNSRFDILTPIYSTGTIEVQAGSPTIVRGTGTSWTVNNVKAGDFIRLSSGATYTTAQTWYEVLSVNVGTQQITLTASAPTTAAGTAYALRQTYSGTTTDIWDAQQFLDDALGPVFLVTNGVNFPMYYNGTGQMQLFSSYPTDFTAAKYIRVFKNRVIFLWTVEGGQNQPIRMRYSETANFQSYNDLEFIDLEQPSPGYWIKGAYVNDEVMVVLKESGGYLVNHVGGDQIFDPNFTSKIAGNFAAFSVVNLFGAGFYYGSDTRIRVWNMLQDQTPLDGIFDYLKNLDPNGAQNIYGYIIEAKRQIRWALPYDSVNAISPVLVFDYANNIIELWEYKHGSAIRSIGEYLNIEDLYVDDPAWAELYVDEEVGFWDSRVFLANAPVVVYGCEDGIIRKADTGTDDDGVDFTRVFRTKRMDHGAPNFRKRLWKQQYWLESRTAGSVTIKIQRDDANDQDVTTKSISLINDNRDIIKETITWDKEYENAKFEVSASNHFEMLGFLSWYFPKRKVVG